MEFKILAILCLAITVAISEATKHEGHQEAVDNFEFDRGVSFLAVRGGKMISELSRVLWGIFELLWPLKVPL